MVIYCIQIFRKKLYLDENESNNKYIGLMIIIFIAYFMVHLLIEVQSRYRYEQYIMMCLTAIPVLDILFEKGYLLNKFKMLTHKK